MATQKKINVLIEEEKEWPLSRQMTKTTKVNDGLEFRVFSWKVWDAQAAV